MTSSDKTEPESNTRTDNTSNPISQVNNRVLPATSIRQARSAGGGQRISQLKRTFAALAAAAENPPLRQHGSFRIDGLGELKTSQVGNFHVVDEKIEGASGVTMSFEHRGNHPLLHKTSSEIAHKALRKTLYGFGLRFRSASSETVHKIELEAVVPAYVMVLVDEAGKQASIKLRNVSSLGATEYRLPASGLDRRLTDALVSLVSDADPAFFQLVSKVARRG